MVVNLTSGMTDVMRHSIEAQFVHLYTRTPRAAVPDDPNTPQDESQDPWGEQNYDPATPLPNLRCFWREPKGQVMVTPNGLQTVVIPSLVVPFDDPINEGDSVSHVLGPPDKNGQRLVLLEGPLEVESVTDQSPGAPGSMGALARVVQLRLVETI